MPYTRWPPQTKLVMVLELPQFTCFTSTKVQILTPEVLLELLQGCGTCTSVVSQFTSQFTCFTSIKVQILTHAPPVGLWNVQLHNSAVGNVSSDASTKVQVLTSLVQKVQILTQKARQGCGTCSCTTQRLATYRATQMCSSLWCSTRPTPSGTSAGFVWER